MAKVLVAPIQLMHVDGPWKDLLLKAGHELVFPTRPAQLLEHELKEILSGCEASLAGSEPYTPDVIAAHPRLKVIARAGVGYDAVNVKAATAQGVAVTTTPGTNHDAVAEYTFTLMLALAKELVSQVQSVRQGGWPRKALLPLRGRTLGILGLGRIGKAVALRGKAFGMKMLAYEPFPDQAFCTECGVTLTALEKVLAEADYLSVHIPLTAESEHLINKRTLALMKPTAFLINTARGGLVKEADLVEALKTKRIAGAAIDVYEMEPPGHSELFALDNCLVTPHAAGVDTQSRDDMAYSAARSIVTILKGEWPSGGEVVNPEVRR
jgi:phosphoglycerate dehydrogenase-like enzyme